jgi:hypothetical protein
MKIKTFFLIVFATALFFGNDAMANLSGNGSAKTENSELNLVKENHPRPFKCTVTYNFTIPGVGIGKATHLGCIITESQFDPVSSTGIEKIHTANGDELDMTWTWDLVDNTGIWQITGGTGRFEYATGSGDWVGVFSPDFQFFTIELTGDIIY